MSDNPSSSSAQTATDDASVSVSSPAEFVGALRAFILRSSGLWGGADIYLTDYDAPPARSGMLSAVLFGLVDEEGYRAVQKYVLLAPPGEDAEDVRREAWGALENAVEALAGAALAKPAADWLARRLHIEVLPDRRTHSVVQSIELQPEKTVVIVMEAAAFRDDAIAPFIGAGNSAPSQPEDVWAPQLHSLARSATEAAREKKLYVALDADRLGPHRPELIDLIMAVDGCGVMATSRDDSPETILSKRSDQWEAWIRAGQVGRILRDVASLPPQLDKHKIFIRAQILNRAGLHTQALQEIRAGLLANSPMDGGARVKLARIAHDAGATNLARELLAATVETLADQDDIESALRIAQSIAADELEAKIASLLGKLYPDSPGLIQRQRGALLEARDYTGLAELSERPSDVRFYEALDRHLSGPGVPDYVTMTDSSGWSHEEAEALRMAAIDDALQRKLPLHAFQLAKSEARVPTWAQQRDQRLLRVLREVFLATSRDERFPVPEDEIESSVESLIRNLSARPGDHSLRVGLAAIVQPAVAGMTGLALIASVVLRLATEPVQLDKRPERGRSTAEWLTEREPFVRSLFTWLEAEEPIVIGRLSIPDDLLTEPADEAVSAISDLLEHLPLASDEDLKAIQTWLALGAAVASHGSTANLDLRLIRLVAGKLASSGYPQAARDLVEHALANCALTATRRRLGWFAMADVYHRVANHTESLLALGCTFANGGIIDEEQAFHEVVALARLLRDIGIPSFAEAAISSARELLQSMGLVQRHGHQLDTLELQIRRQRLARDPTSLQFQELLQDAMALGEEVLGSSDHTEPVASVLGQLLRQARGAGAPTPAAADAVLAKLIARAKGTLATQLRALHAAAPTADDMFALLRASGTARYSEDAGYDMQSLALLASRALADDIFLSNTTDASFALELLADRGVAIPGWDEAAEPPPMPESVPDIASAASQISMEGVSLVQVGWDEDGRLARLDAVNGVLGPTVREREVLISEKTFGKWSASFPYAYGIDEATANLFYTTTADLRFSTLPKGPVVLVSDVGFQAFPPNLLFVENDFAGRSRPMAAAPSLSWLVAARARGPVGDGRRRAWISAADSGDGGSTLATIAQRLGPALEDHGILLDQGSSLPTAFAGADMAVIAAHGGVHPEGRYFQVVSDEGALRVSGGDFANALRNIGVVVLFVCSAGRSDKHPAANTTIGLSKQILDRGSTAVIASPWPLDSRVPAHWLPTFLKRWEEGASLIEANFAANAVVDRAFSQDPARGLAMSVFGNPLLRKPSRN